MKDTRIKPHSFCPIEAKQYSIEKAILLYNMRFWLDKNKANETNVEKYIDGKYYYWTYNSSIAFEKLFPYLKASSIRRWLNELEKDGIIISGTFNKSNLDNTKWYSIKEEYECTNSKVISIEKAGCSKSEDRMIKIYGSDDQNIRSIPDINNTDINKISLSKDRDSVLANANDEQLLLFIEEQSPGKEEKKEDSFGRSDINDCHFHFQKVFGHLPDGTINKNRQFCNHLLNKFKKSYPAKNNVELVKRLIERAKSSDWHSDKATSFMYLYYHAEAIIASTKKSNFNKVIAPEGKYDNIKVITYTRDSNGKLIEKNKHV